MFFPIHQLCTLFIPGHRVQSYTTCMWLLLLLTICGQQDTACCQINWASPKTQLHPLCVLPGVYLCLQTAWCCSQVQAEAIAPQFTAPTPCLQQLHTACHHTPIVLSATRQAPRTSRSLRAHSRTENKTNQKTGSTCGLLQVQQTHGNSSLKSQGCRYAWPGHNSLSHS